MNDVLDYMTTLRAEGYSVSIANGSVDGDPLIYLRMRNAHWTVNRTVSVRELHAFADNLILKELKDMHDGIELKKAAVRSGHSLPQKGSAS